MEKLPSFPGSKVFTVGKVNVKVGDIVEEGQELFQVETKKGNRVIKAKQKGILSTLLVAEGETVQVNQDIYSLKEVNPELILENESNDISSNFSINGSFEEKKVDLIIIGGGTGGYVSAIRAAKAGKKVLLVEKNKMGGTCLNIGCIPTKSLIASSERFEEACHSSDFGIEIEGSIKPNMAAIVERKNNIVEKLTGGVEYLMEKNQIEIIYGQARFENNKEILITNNIKTKVTFNNCIIATGSVVAIPNIPGIDSENILTSTEALNLSELPESITIVGGGVIGLEFAFMFRQFGVKVTVIEFLEHLLATMDYDISEEIERLAIEKGINLQLNSKVTSFSQSIDQQLITHFEKAGQVQAVVSDKVLVAVGRKPNIDNLGLENTDIVINEKTKGINVDSNMRTQVDEIFAVGDVNNLVQLAHAASKQGIIAVETILGEDNAFISSNTPSVVFTSPEIASVGLTEKAAKDQGIEYTVGRFNYEANGKALTVNRSEGFVKILKDTNDFIIGGAIIGADASTIIATLTTYVTSKMKVEQVENIIFAHPTTAEVLHEATLDLTLGAFHE